MVEFLKEYFFTIGLTVVCLFGSLFVSRLIQKNYEKYKSRDLLTYKPTVWTSIGILGTFISIVYSLCYNQNDFRDIQLLIKNISPAFLTSIIGIVGSIVTSYRVKLLLAEEDTKTDSEYKNFIANPGCITSSERITPEMQLFSIYKNINEINNSNNTKLQSIFECLDKQFGENGLFQQFQKNLSTQVETEFKNNRVAINDLFKKDGVVALYQKELFNSLNTTIEDNLSKINGAIVESVGNEGLVQKSVSKDITELKASISSELSENGVLSKHINEVSQGVRELKQTEESISTFLNTTIGEQGVLNNLVETQAKETRSTIVGFQTKLSGDLGENGILSNRINEVSQRVSELKQTEDSISTFLNTTIGEHGVLNTLIESQTKETRNAIVDLQTKLSDDLGENGVIVGRIHNAMTSITSELSTQNLKIKTFLDELIKNISDYYQQVSKETADATVSLIEKNFVDYKTIFSSYNAELAKNLDNYGEELKIVETQFLSDQNEVLKVSLASNIDNINKRTELIEGINNSLIRVLNENKTGIETAIEKIKDDIISSMGTIQTAFVENAKENSNTLQNTAKELITKTQESTDNLKKILEDKNDALNTDLNTLVSSFNSSTSKMQTNWVASMNTLKESVEGQQVGLQSVITKFGELAKSNTATINSLSEHLSSSETALEEFNGHLEKIDKNIKDYTGIQERFTENYEDSIQTLGMKIGNKIDVSILDFSEKIDSALIMLKGTIQQSIDQNSKDTQNVVKQLTKDYSSSNKEELELIKELKKLV